MHWKIKYYINEDFIDNNSYLVKAMAYIAEMEEKWTKSKCQ